MSAETKIRVLDSGHKTKFETRPHRTINIIMAVVGCILGATLVIRLVQTGQAQLLALRPRPELHLILQSASIPISNEQLTAWMIWDAASQQVYACEVQVVSNTNNKAEEEEEQEEETEWKEIHVWTGSSTSSASSKPSWTRYSGFVRPESGEWTLVTCSTLNAPALSVGTVGSITQAILDVVQGNSQKNQTNDLIIWGSIQDTIISTADVQKQTSFLAHAAVPAPHVCNRDSLANLRAASWADVYPDLVAKAKEAQAHATLLATKAKLEAVATTKIKTKLKTQGLKECRRDMIGNGHCDAVCNDAEYDWDGGDCCISTPDDSSSNAKAFELEMDCQSGPMVLLLHGASVNVINSANLSTQFTDVSPQAGIEQKLKSFGLLPRLLRAVARKIILNAHNTYAFGWDNRELQRAYYDKALYVYESGGLVFAHSMANLVLAGACLDQGLCAVKWYAVGAPWRGSRVLGLSYPVKGVKVNLNNTGVQSMRPGFRDLFQGQLTRIVKKHNLLLGAVCGASAYGSGGTLGSEFSALATLSTRQEPWRLLTDGITTVAECTLDGDDVNSRNAVPANLWEPVDNDVNWQQLLPLAAFQVDNATHPFAILNANHRDLAGSPWTFQTPRLSIASRQRFEAVLHWYLARFAVHSRA